jgi:exodeoxyribonuclease-5
MQPEEFAKTDPAFRFKGRSIPETDLIIVDEGSMVDHRIGRDLLRTGHQILVLADPARLGPVNGGEGFFMRGEPDVMLTEIHRQQLESPVLQLATAARNGERLRIGLHGASRVIEGADLTAPMALDAHQILVGRNETRRAFNRRMRKHLGFADWLPMLGDKLVCLKNNHDRGLLNGSLWRVESIWKGKGEQTGRQFVSLAVRCEDDGRSADVVVPVELFGYGDAPHEEFYDAFTYGYALTAHKAQGSEWDNVLVIDESRCFRDERSRWLYTAITRASERVIVVRNWSPDRGASWTK